MSTWYVKQGDLGTSLAAQLLLGSGSALALTGATVRFHARPKGRTSVSIDAAAIITDAPNGRVRYDFTAGQTDVAGTYDVEWEVTLPGGQQVTFPNDGYDALVITAQIT